MQGFGSNTKFDRCSQPDDLAIGCDLQAACAIGHCRPDDDASEGKARDALRFSELTECAAYGEPEHRERTHRSQGDRSELSLFQPTLPVEPSYAISGSQRDWDMEELLVFRCAAVPTGRIQFGVKLAGSA